MIVAKLSAEEIDAMFDVEPESSSSDQPADYGSSNETESNRPFDDLVDDLKCSMESEVTSDESDNTVKTSSTIESRVNMVSESKMVPVADPSVSTSLEGENLNSQDSHNPLGLNDEDLRAYNNIKKKYPHFMLHDGSVAFKDFYRNKLKVLKWLLTSFPLLPLKSMREEVNSIHLNHQVGNKIASPDLIRQKLDEVGLCRPRLTTLIIQALDQHPIWKKNVEMLKSKLLRDHDCKSHQREGLAFEHMRDISDYSKELEGFIDSANFVDSFLKQTVDNLSRQLSCVLTDTRSFYNRQHDVQSPSSKTDSNLDSFDTIDKGSVISKVSKDGLVDFDFGSGNLEDDEFSKIG